MLPGLNGDDLGRNFEMTNSMRSVLGYGLAFFLVTSVTIFWTRFSGGLALVWPGTAIAAAMYLRLENSRWLGPTLFFVGLSATATALFGFGPRLAVPLAAVNLLEALLAATLLLKLRPQRDYLESGTGIFSLALATGVLAPAISAIPGGYLASLQVGGQWYQHSASWLAGHGLGTVLVLPLLLLLASYGKPSIAAPHDWRKVTLFVAVAAFTLGVSALAMLQSDFPLLYLTIVPLVLACFSFGRLGASTAVLIVTLVAAGSLGSGVGVFAGLDLPLSQKALFVQLYLAILFLLCLPMAVALKQRSRLMAEISEREALQRLIADHSDDALLHLDNAGRITFASPASERLSGVRDPMGAHFGTLFGQNGARFVGAALERAARAHGQTQIFESSVMREDTERWLEAKIQAVSTGGAKPLSYVVTIRDVTARKLDELLASHEARTDALTGLPNRRAFLDRIEEQLATAEDRPFVLALIDLDHFKLVNDSYGHDTGDDVLQKLASIMRGFASPNCFFARLGGEEFGMIAMNEALEDAWRICEQLRIAIQNRELTDREGNPFSITTSIGMAQIAESCSASAAMSIADRPLYAAKASGRNCLRQASRSREWAGGLCEGGEPRPIALVN